MVPTSKKVRCGPKSTRLSLRLVLVAACPRVLRASLGDVAEVVRAAGHSGAGLVRVQRTAKDDAVVLL